MYDNKMKQEDWGLETIERWAKILTKLQITKSEFDKAEAAAELLGGWPIKHPADFLALGRTETGNGYPDTRKAYEHAVDYSGRLFDDRDDWKHVVIYETARRIGFTKLATSSELFTWSLWRDTYAKVCDEHKAGAEFNLPLDKSKQLAHSHTPVQQGTAASANIDAFLAKFGSKQGETA